MHTENLVQYDPYCNYPPWHDLSVTSTVLSLSQILDRAAKVLRGSSAALPQTEGAERDREEEGEEEEEEGEGEEEDEEDAYDYDMEDPDVDPEPAEKKQWALSDYVTS